MRRSSRKSRITLPIILLAALFLLNVFLLGLPLVGQLGYEFSAINAIVLYLIGGVCAIYFSRRVEKDSFTLKQFFRNNDRILLSLIALPFLIGFFSSVFFSKCPLAEGIAFYLIITVPAYLLGMAVGIYSSVISRKYSYLIFLFSFLVVFLLPLRELFFNPQVYFYNPLIGYFPGTIYDEGISITKLLIAYRILNISFAITLVYLASLIRQKKIITKAISLFGVVLLLVVFVALKPSLKFSTDKEALNKNLGVSLSTNNFLIHYNSKSMFIGNTNYLAGLHEYYLDQIKSQLEVPFHGKIDSYIFQSRTEKQELMGAGNANVAKPWLRQIYLNYSSYEETLKHELLHIVAGTFGSTPLKVAGNFNSAMIEGLAVAVDNNYDGLPVNYLAKLAWQNNYRVSITDLFSGANFFSHTSSLSYIYAGSFIRFLIERFGIQKVKQLYSSMDFNKVCGKDVSLLASDYIHFLDDYKIDSNKYKAQLYFGSKPIFKKYCPRFAANQLREASADYNHGKFDDALKLFRKIYSYSASYNALAGVVHTLSKQKKFWEAASFLKNEISKFVADQNYFILELTLGDLLIESNQYEAAVEEYDSLLAQNPHVGYSNEVLIRKALIAEGTDSLTSYLESSDTLKVKKLLELNEKEIRYFSVPRLINLAENLHRDISDFLIRMKQKLKVENYESSYAALHISKYFLKRMDFENAQFFAVKSVTAKLDPDAKYAFVENLRMVNWFKNFSNELKVN